MSEHALTTTTGGHELTTALERDRMIREAAAAYSGKIWGQKLSVTERAAVARYALEADLDPLRHIDVLGGRVYPNAEAYLDRLKADPDFERIAFKRITEDKARRAEWAIPAYATEAFLCRIWHRGRVFDEVGYAPSNKNDPVGTEHPGKTARTRAIRRTARLVVPMWTRKLDQHFGKFEILHTSIKEQQAASGALPAPAEGTVRALRRAPNGDWESADVPEAEAARPMREVVTHAELTRPAPEFAEDYQDGPDPYAGDMDLFEGDAGAQRPPNAIDGGL